MEKTFLHFFFPGEKKTLRAKQIILHINATIHEFKNTNHDIKTFFNIFFAVIKIFIKNYIA